MITDIQKYSIHDGAGIRTTIFFKGCPLRCSWCHNPETQKYEQEVFYYKERCTGCGQCGGGYYEDCVNNAKELCGKEVTVKGLLKEIQKDMAFYETSGGGVTLSGGEVLSQDMEFIHELVKSAYDRGISVNIDTCGQVDFSHFEKIIPYINVFLYDIKVMDDEKHRKYTGSSNELILENLKKLAQRNAKVWLRIPVIGGVNDDEANLMAIISFLRENAILPEHIHLLPYHDIGSSKYLRLGREYKESFYVPEDSTMDKLKGLFEQNGFSNVYIGG